METGFGESTGAPSHGPSCSGSVSSDTANFECNICFELPQDPIVTLCGHLYCWPCIYKWLNIHSHSRECPVCKALVQEDKVVPIYGRGKAPLDPRSRSIPGEDIPNRPSGQRPETAPSPTPNHFPQQGLGFGMLGGFMPMATARIGNITLSAAFSGFIPALFNLHVHGLHDAALYGPTTGFPYGFSNAIHGGPAHGFHDHLREQQHSDTSLVKMLLLLFGVLTVLYLIL